MPLSPSSPDPASACATAGVAARQLCAALDVPHVHTPHSLGFWKQRQMLTDYPGDAAKFELTYNFSERNLTEKEIYRDADMVLATTPDQVDLLRGHYDVPKEKLRMIPPGYDDTRFYPVGSSTRELLRRKFGFEGKVVLSLGRIARNKGYDLLIRAFAEVAARDEEARLHLAIGGERLEPAEVLILESCRELAQSLARRRSLCSIEAEHESFSAALETATRRSSRFTRQTTHCSARGACASRAKPAR